MAENPHWPTLPDREAARRTAATVGLAGVPVSMREDADAPRPGVGTGHWRRHVERLSAAVERSAVAAAQVPPGGLRNELDRILEVVRLRLDRYTHIAAVGQALVPDDDTTDLDGTAPGVAPVLDGAAEEVDQRLRAALRHLDGLAAAVEQIAVAGAGLRNAEDVQSLVDRALSGVPPP